VSEDAKNVIELLLIKEPLLRGSAENILKHKWFDTIHASIN
jgi:hypothetical protein